MTRQSTYLDYNASAPASRDVMDMVASVMAEGGNPSSVHGNGRKARARVEDARRCVAALVGAKPAEVIFTGGGTEANTLGLKGLIAAQGIECLVVSAIEHPSVLELAKAAKIDVQFVAVNADGLVEGEALKAALKPGKKTLVSIMLANNESGVIQPIAELTSIAKEAGAFVHCDAIQAAGKIAVNFSDLGVDLMSLSAHKLGGPQGVGALILKSGLVIEPLAHGGGQEFGRRSGTENVAGIAGFGVAAEAARTKLSAPNELEIFRNRMEREMAALAPEAVFISKGAPRLPNTCLVALPGVAAETQVIQMDLAGFAVSSGSACSSGKVARSHVLDAMEVGDALAGSALRISFGPDTDEIQLVNFLEAWSTMRNKLFKDTETLEGARHVAG